MCQGTKRGRAKVKFERSGRCVQGTTTRHTRHSRRPRSEEFESGKGATKHLEGIKMAHDLGNIRAPKSENGATKLEKNV